MSLSRRLVLILLAVATVGLLTLSLVSYFALRSYLSDRVDQQARDAVPLVVRAVRLSSSPGCRFPLTPWPPREVTVELPPTARSACSLPAGTYGQITGADGQMLAGTHRQRRS